jgi:hypothetical protein
VTKFRRETLDGALWAEIMPLLERHWIEVAHYSDIPLHVDVNAYAMAEANGFLRVYTIRDDATLVGYAAFFVRPNPHYASSLQAVQDVIYLHPDYRGGTGARFIAWCDAQLREQGVQAVYHHVKQAHNWGPMLERMGYELVDLIFAKRLDR